MRWFLTVLGVILGLVVFLFLDYALPSKQTVRITNTYNRLTDIGANAMFFASPDTGTVQNAQGQRDVRFVDTVRTNGKPYVYRNEDTGWIWPPYFKYDSSNLHAQVTDLKSTSAAPQWVSITSYGWRIAAFSIYPNIIAAKPVSGPDDKPFNWSAQIILLLLGALLFLIWRMWNQFHERTIEPVVRSVDETWDRIDASADAARDQIVAEANEASGRVRGWWNRLRGK